MLSDPRSIAYLAELIQPQLRWRPEALQKLYAKMIEQPELAFANFNAQPGGAQMSTVHGVAVEGETSHSSLTFLPDRLQIREEWPRIGFDDFLSKSCSALELVMSELAIPAFSVVNCTVRCLVNARNVDDSRSLMAELLGCTLEQGFDDFGRAPNLLGVRMAFPATPEDPSVHNVRVESFGRDPRSIFLEETRVVSTPITPGDIDAFGRAFRSAYDFVTDNVPAWLARTGET